MSFFFVREDRGHEKDDRGQRQEGLKKGTKQCLVQKIWKNQEDKEKEKPNVVEEEYYIIPQVYK